MSSMLAPASFTQDAFDAFLATRDEPGWLSDMRRAAWSRFDELAMPTGRDEEWMRTDIRLFKLSKFSIPTEAPEVQSPRALLAEGVELGGSTVSVDSHSTENEFSEKWASKEGVLFGSLDTLVAEHGDRLRPYFERKLVDPLLDKFSALNAACWSSGNLLLVPRGVRVDEPLHNFSILSDGGTDMGKTLVILEEGAEATLLAETASVSDQSGGLHWLDRADRRKGSSATVRQSSELEPPRLAFCSSNGACRWNQRVALTGSDAEAQVNGVMFTQGKQHLCYNTHQHHQAPHCQSDLMYKAALQDRSRTVWRGMIQVDKAGQQTNAYQRNDNLMLSTMARADSIPGLEIEADDVRCTHGSTSGRVDDDQLFYAMTRAARSGPDDRKRFFPKGV